jgi:HNH endonuclease
MSLRYGTVEERIERDTFFEPNSGCWLFAGPIDDFGYGRIRIGKKKVRVHKHTYEQDNGPLPEGVILRHSCDMPCCWNPDHLLTGTHADNRNDAMLRGRIPNGTRAAGNKLTNADILAIRASDETHRAIGLQFGVSHNVVGRIKRREKWRHLP